MLLLDEFTPALAGQIHNRPVELFRRENLNAHPRLANLGDGALVGQVSRAFDESHFARVGHDDLIFYARSGCHQIEIVFALQSFLDDLHVEQAPESHT